MMIGDYLYFEDLHKLQFHRGNLQSHLHTKSPGQENSSEKKFKEFETPFFVTSFNS